MCSRRIRLRHVKAQEWPTSQSSAALFSSAALEAIPTSTTPGNSCLERGDDSLATPIQTGAPSRGKDRCERERVKGRARISEGTARLNISHPFEVDQASQPQHLTRHKVSQRRLVLRTV